MGTKASWKNGKKATPTSYGDPRTFFFKKGLQPGEQEAALEATKSF